MYPMRLSSKFVAAFQKRRYELHQDKIADNEINAFNNRNRHCDRSEPPHYRTLN